MKLWQKIALISLTFILIAVNVTAVTVLNLNFSYLMEQTQQQAIERHQHLEVTILNTVAYTRLQNGTLMLTPNEVDAVLQSIASDTNWAIYSETELLAQNKADLILADSDFQATVVQHSDQISLKSDLQDGQHLLLLGSALTIEGNHYYLYTLRDTTALFDLFTSRTAMIKLFSLLFSCAIALVLLVITFLLLRPLTNLNQTIKAIANGDYSLRTGTRGSPEFVELSDNINQMATAIEQNVTTLQDIADSRTQFVDNFAHEMKTPLTSILCFSDLLRIKRNVSETERQEYASVIFEEANRMKVLSAKLLEITTANRLTLDRKPLQLESVIQEIVTAITPILQQRHLSLQVHLVDGTVFADHVLLKSLLFNLLDNAIKASSDHGQICLTCTDDGHAMSIAVQDFGIGMTADHLHKITEPFYMVDKSRSRKAGGAGLGLALCESIATAHHATLSFESTVGVGTTVTLQLPKRGDNDETI